MTGGYTQYLDPYQQAMLAYGGGGPTAQPQAQTVPGPPGPPGTQQPAAPGSPAAPGDKTHGARDWGSVGSWAGMIGGAAIPGVGGFLAGPVGNTIGNAFDVARGNRAIDEANQTWGTSIPGMGAGALGRGVLNDTLLGSIFGWGRDPTQATRDAIQAGKQAIAGPLDFTDGTRFTGSSPFGGMDTQATKDAAVDAWGGPGGLGGGSPGKSGDSLGSDYTGGNYGGAGKGGDRDNGLYAKGGKVRPPRPGAANPPGPDDQVAGLQTGEGVINRPAMQGGWGGLLDVINSDQGGALAKLLKGLLK